MARTEEGRKSVGSSAEGPNWTKPEKWNRERMGKDLDAVAGYLYESKHKYYSLKRTPEQAEHQAKVTESQQALDSILQRKITDKEEIAQVLERVAVTVQEDIEKRVSLFGLKPPKISTKLAARINALGDWAMYLAPDSHTKYQESVRHEPRDEASPLSSPTEEYLFGKLPGQDEAPPFETGEAAAIAGELDASDLLPFERERTTSKVTTPEEMQLRQRELFFVEHEGKYLESLRALLAAPEDGKDQQGEWVGYTFNSYRKARTQYLQELEAQKGREVMERVAVILARRIARFENEEVRAKFPQFLSEKASEITPARFRGPGSFLSITLLGLLSAAGGVGWHVYSGSRIEAPVEQEYAMQRPYEPTASAPGPAFQAPLSGVDPSTPRVTLDEVVARGPRPAEPRESRLVAEAAQVAENISPVEPVTLENEPESEFDPYAAIREVEGLPEVPEMGGIPDVLEEPPSKETP